MLNHTLQTNVILYINYTVLYCTLWSPIIVYICKDKDTEISSDHPKEMRLFSKQFDYFFIVSLKTCNSQIIHTHKFIYT